MDKVAVYTGSRNLYENMVIAAKSLVANSKVDKIYFFIEDDIFPYKLPDFIETKNVSNQTYFDKNGPNMTSQFTYFALMRAALAFELPEYDTVLSLDVDTIAVRKCDDVWNLPLDDNYFSASIEPHRSHNGLVYTNAGVSLFNLKKLRDSGKAEEVIDILNRHKFSWVDQDVLNYLCQGYILDMPSEYNANDYTKPCTRPRIIHYAGIPHKVWNQREAVGKYRNMSWDDVFIEQHQLEYKS